MKEDRVWAIVYRCVNLTSRSYVVPLSGPNATTEQFTLVKFIVDLGSGGDCIFLSVC